MIHINGLADQNDIAKVLKKYKEEDIISVMPCPRGEGNKINPHVTRFMLKTGEYLSVFHVKPIYYETLDFKWRPLSEVTTGYGNKWIDFRGDWHEKMHPRYMNWLLKRLELISGKPEIAKPSTITVEGEPLTVQ